MPAPKGHPRYGGRAKGQPNKLNLAAREAFQFAFDSIGGAERLAAWAEENQTDFYKIYGRLIPVQATLANPDGSPLQLHKHEDVRVLQVFVREKIGEQALRLLNQQGEQI